MFHGLPNLPARFVTQRERGLSSHLASVWTSVEDASEDKSVTALLREFDPGTQSISVAASEGGRAYLRVQHETLGRVPLEFQGAGFGKALSLSAEVIAAKNGILLIDEFEDSLHVGAQGAIAAFLLKAARKYGVQLFITTHSLETIDALVERFDASKELFDSSADLRVHQFMKTDEGIRCRTLDFEKAKQLRNDFGLDLRRSS
jgi:predicted ATPase